MEYFLLFSLVVLFFAIYRLDGKRITTPGCLAILVFLISSLVFTLNAVKWDTEISIETVLLIISALLIFGMGSRSKVSFYYGKKRPTKEVDQIINYNIKPSVILILFAVGIVVDFVIYRRAMQILTGRATIRNMLFTLRVALADDAKWGTGISILREGYYAIGYSSIFAYCVNVSDDFKATWKKWGYILLPAIPMLIAMFLSTGRTGFIRVVCVIFITLITLVGYRKRIKLGKFFRIGILVFVLLLFVFFQLGKATGKSQIFSAFDTLSIYVGSSIGALDGYLKNPVSYSNSFGGETLYGFRRIARFFDERIIATPIPLPFHRVIHGYNTNVYTALRRYINDFGIGGMYIIMFLEGMFFGNWEYFVRKEKRKDLSLLLYAYFMYDVILIAIEENFFREMLTFAQIFIVVAFILFYYYVLAPSRVNVSLRE